VLPFVLVAVGCHNSPPPVYPVWATRPAAYSPSPGSGNAFDVYAQSALDIESSAKKHLLRVSFYPDQRTSAMEACAGALEKVQSASRLPCDFKFVPRGPFEPAPYQQGWRLLGRVLRWRIEDACHAKDFEKAIDTTILATRFGFDLTGGGATDASLGLAIVDDARSALAPSLPELGAGQLARLAEGIEEAIKRKPPIDKAVANEQANTKMAIQALQDAYAKRDYKEFETNLGPDVKDAIEYLSNLQGEDKKRADYFNGFAAEGEKNQARLMKNAGLPFAQREDTLKFPAGLDRPWKRFSHHFFSAAEPLLEMNDRTMARTQLLAISAEVYRTSKATKAFPRDLSALPPDLIIDPYTGTQFLYHADPSQFSVYSVGKDLRDDNGDSDPTFTKPDLRLEYSN